MGIDPIRQHPSPSSPGSPSPQSLKPSRGAPAPAAKDTVELSPEAQQLHDLERQELLERVRHRLQSNFYAQPEVLRTVAERILHDLQPKQ